VSDGTKVSQTGQLVKNQKGYGEGCDRSTGAGCGPSSSLSEVIPVDNAASSSSSDSVLDAKFGRDDTPVTDDVSLLDVLTGPVAPVKCPKQPNFLCPLINSKPDCTKCLFCPLKPSDKGKLQFCPDYDCKKCPRNEHHGGGKGEEYVIVVTDGHYEFNTPDCFHVVVDYEAGFKGTIIKHSSVKKIDGCRPSGGGYECGTGATLDRSGKPCTGSESPTPI